MDIAINKASPVPIRRQIVDQIALLISTGQLRPGDALVSVRQFARQHRISRTTVSAAYQELTGQHWLKNQRGKRLVVRSPQESPVIEEPDLDQLINRAIQMARERGYTLEELTARVRERLLREPPDHVLVVSRDRVVGKLLAVELRDIVAHRVDDCLLEELQRHPGTAIGALVTCLPGLVWDVSPVLPGGRYAFPLQVSGTDEQVDQVRNLTRPSLIVLASVSAFFLETAQALLAPVTGRRHAIETCLLHEGETRNLSAADIVFCDSLVRSTIVGKTVVPYRIVSTEVGAWIDAAIDVRNDGPVPACGSGRN